MAAIESRRNSDGTVTYRAKVRLKGLPSQTATFKRKTDAQRWVQKVETELREGRHFHLCESRKHVFAELASRYTKEVLGQRPKNVANSQRHINYWSAKLGHLTLAEITPAIIVACRTELLAEQTRRKKLRSPATVVRYLATLSHAFSIALRDWQWVTENPVSKISKPREPRGRERFLSEFERERLLTACQHSASPYLHAVVVLAISTGMRRGEIMNLKWSDIDFGRHMILLTETKNGTSRSVPLISLAHERLSELAKVRRIDTSLVFPSKKGDKPIELKRPWDEAIKVAGLSNFRFHDLRHTAASYLAMNGATTMDIASVLGHKTLAMVRRYSHLTHSHTHQVVQSMNEKIFGGQKHG